MVSNSLKMDLKDLLAAIARIKAKHGKTAKYKELRKELPKDWPL